MNLKIYTIYSNKNEWYESGGNSKLLCILKLQIKKMFVFFNVNRKNTTLRLDLKLEACVK